MPSRMTHICLLKKIVLSFFLDSGKFLQPSSTGCLQVDKAMVAFPVGGTDNKCKVCLRGSVSGSYASHRMLNLWEIMEVEIWLEIWERW